MKTGYRSSPRTAPLRRIFATTAIAAGLLIAGLTPVGSAVAADADGLLVEYRFDQTAGTSIPNLAPGSPFGPAVLQNGDDGQWSDDSLSFTGDNWVRLPDALLSDAHSATITTEVKIDASMKSTNHFLWNVGNQSNESYFFATTKDSPRTAITTASGNGEVNARAAENMDADRWYSLTAVIDGAAHQIRLYVDGRQVSAVSTTLTPASLTDQSLNTIGRSPWNDPNFRGAVSHFRVFDRALDGAEITAISDQDAQVHPEGNVERAQKVLTGLQDPTVISDSVTTLPDLGGTVRWSTTSVDASVDADGKTLRVTQPAVGSGAATISLSATASVRGSTANRIVSASVQTEAAATDHYGYMLVHFIEDAQGYAEKIYLDVSRGNNPEQWDPLNGGKPILASALGTTGVRDPYLTRNPDTGTYYIIATDLRVFGGDGRDGSQPCQDWCYWGSQGSNNLVIWESDDLVTWSAPRTLNVAPPGGRLGMAWAPEATWVADYNGAGTGAFVVYWSSRIAEGGDNYSSGRILWGATTDFTQSTFTYGGTFLDEGGFTIDATLLQNEGKTYRIAKDQSWGKNIFMDVTDSPTWWQSDTQWVRVQENIGRDAYGGVEGPGGFKRNDADEWYLYVDVIPQIGYQPMVTTNLDQGFTPLDDKTFFMTPSTKHGGILGLTKADYDHIRASDATSAVSADLGTVTVEDGQDVSSALPATAEVNTAYGRGTQNLPVTWDVSNVDASNHGAYAITGVVRTIGANDNDWVGKDGSTLYTAPDKRPFSSTAITVTATVVISGATPSPTPTPTPDPTPTGPPGSTATAAFSSTTVAQGGVVRVSVSGLQAAEQTTAEVHSDPIRVTGIPAADAGGRVVFDVTIPSDLAPGAHTIAIWRADGSVVAQQQITVTAKAALASTGGRTPIGTAALALVLLTLGAAAWRARRRTTNAPL